MQGFAGLIVAALGACSGGQSGPADGGSGDGGPPGTEVGSLVLGDYLLENQGSGRLRIASAQNPARTLLSSPEVGVGAYAPAATGVGSSSIETLYGAFKFTETAPTSWRAARKLVLTQTATGGTLSWLDAQGGMVLSAQATVDRGLRLQLTAPVGTNRTSLAFACATDDRFIGFGAQADALDHHGHKIPIFTSEPGIGKTTSDDPDELWFVEGTRHASSYALPVWMSNRGYMGVLQTDGRSIFELCTDRADAWRVEAWAAATLWLFDGPPKAAMEKAAAAVLGYPKRPPPVAFAPWNDALFGPARVREVAALLRSRKIPSSVIWTEDFRGGEPVGANGYRLKEEWSLDRTLYPGAEALASELRAQGFGWQAYFNTFLISETTVYDEGLAGGHFVKNAAGEPYIFQSATFKPAGLADLSRPATREWVKGFMRAALDIGFDGWMADFGEWLPHDAKLFSGEDPMLAHNRYAHEWVKLNDEVLAERAADGRQRVFFARAGWFGSAAHTPVLWAGDQRTSFQRDDGLFTVIPMGLGLGLVGVSTFAHDIGGYQSATNPPANKELFFRWTSLGALTPVMRNHHGTQPRLQWWFGSDEETIAHYTRWSKLHIRLFPYLDGNSQIAETTGVPLFRALPYEFPDDAAGWTIADQYLLGPSLLVAPVVDAGQTSRRVHFPTGTWLPLWGGPPQVGPADVDVPAPLTELPAFVRAGSVLPLLPPEVETLLPVAAGSAIVDLAAAQNRRTLWWYTGGTGVFTERDGTRYECTGTLPAAPTIFRENGAQLPTCSNAASRGCLGDVDTAARSVVVRLSGNGPLDVDSARLAITGTARTVDVLVRW